MVTLAKGFQIKIIMAQSRDWNLIPLEGFVTLNTTIVMTIINSIVKKFLILFCVNPCDKTMTLKLLYRKVLIHAGEIHGDTMNLQLLWIASSHGRTITWIISRINPWPENHMDQLQATFAKRSSNSHRRNSWGKHKPVTSANANLSQGSIPGRKPHGLASGNFCKEKF